jgi:hypothetical protein
MIELSTDPGDLVIDPFGGTGIVAATASVMGRKGLAMDVVPGFAAHFESEVVPAVRTWWEHRSAERELSKAQDEAFFRANVGLRVVRFARLLTDASLATGSRVAGAWIHVERPRRKPPWARGRVTVLLKDSERVGAVEAAMETAMSRPPLSKFGLDIKASPKVAAHYRPRTSGFLYANTGTPIAVAQMSAREFVANAVQAPHPLVGGNVRISADDVLRVTTRGWKNRDVNLALHPDGLKLFA